LRLGSASRTCGPALLATADSPFSCRYTAFASPSQAGKAGFG
jgi:hypothetical protein